MSRRSLALLLITLTSFVAKGGVLPVGPPIPGSLPSRTTGVAGRQAPPLQRALPPGPPPPPMTSVVPPAPPADEDRPSLVLQRVTVRPGERVRVLAGPGAVTPGRVLLDVQLDASAQASRHVVVAVAATEHTDGLPALLVVRS